MHIATEPAPLDRQGVVRLECNGWNQDRSRHKRRPRTRRHSGCPSRKPSLGTGGWALKPLNHLTAKSTPRHRGRQTHQSLEPSATKTRQPTMTDLPVVSIQLAQRNKSPDCYRGETLPSSYIELPDRHGQPQEIHDHARVSHHQRRTPAHR